MSEYLALLVIKGGLSRLSNPTSFCLVEFGVKQSDCPLCLQASVFLCRIDWRYSLPRQLSLYHLKRLVPSTFVQVDAGEVYRL